MQYIIVILYFVVPDKCNTFNNYFYHYFVYQAFLRFLCTIILSERILIFLVIWHSHAIFYILLFNLSQKVTNQMQVADIKLMSSTNFVKVKNYF